MVRSAYVLAALLIPGVAVAQTTTTTTSLPQRDTRPVTGSSVIRGRVIDASTGAPLRKASVRISSPEIRETRSAITDAEGRYEFTELPAGQFSLNVSKAGYIDIGYGQKAPSEMGKPLKLGDKQVVEKIDFSVPRGAVITGRVLDEYGEPVTDAQVSLLRNNYTASGPRPMNAGRPTTTNDIGEFRLFGLAPGQYFLAASYRAQQMMFINGSTTGDDAGYAVTYYPGTASLADAQKLSIGLGGSVSDVTLMLVQTRTARVTGTAFDGQGRALKQGSVMMLSRNGVMNVLPVSAMIRPDGTFNISGVVPGEYVVRAMIPGQPGTPAESSMAAISVNGTDITDLRLEPLRPITVSGHVVLDPVAARSFKPETMRLNAQPSEPGLLSGPLPPPAAVRDDLTFDFKATPGPSIVRLAPTPGWMIKSVSLNGADVTDGLTFRSDDVSGLEVELTNRVPDLSGQVTNGNGDAVLDYYVVVFPQDQDLWNAPGNGRTGLSRPDDQGRYRFRALRPGTYYVVAVEHVQTGEWMDPTWMESVRSRATRVTLNEGDTLVADLKLTEPR